MAYIIIPIHSLDIEKHLTLHKSLGEDHVKIEELQAEVTRLKSLVEKQKRAIFQRTRFECDEPMNSDGFCNAS